MPAMREPLSGPWQRKHVSDMMGRMSRLNPTRSGSAAARAPARQSPAIQGQGAARRKTGRMEHLICAAIAPNARQETANYRGPKSAESSHLEHKLILQFSRASGPRVGG